MTNYAEIIKRLVTVPEAVERYTSERVVHNRIRCPIHHGQDRNMRIYRNSYYCFVCHEHGDVIRFVQTVLGIPFKDALDRLNQDFGLCLPIGAEQTEADRKRIAELNRKAAERRRLEDARRSDAEARERVRTAWIGLLHQVEIICQEQAPTGPWDEWKPDWCEAMMVRTELYEQVR